MSADSRRGVATLADMAEELGLSVPTISRALRDHPDVSSSTRSRVKQAAERIGYRGSVAARALRTGRHHALSFVIPYELLGWWEPLLRGAGAEAARRGYRLVLNPVSAAGTGEDLSRFFARASDEPVDGFIVVTPDAEEWKDLAAQQAAPVVIIDDLREHPGYEVWCSDGYLGARAAVEHLIDRGRRNIIALSPEAAFPGDALPARLRGYRDAVAEAALPERVLVTAETFPASLEFSDAIDAVIAEGAPFDAVFAPADFVAYAVLRSLRRSGLTVPEDVSVIGFDDDPAAFALDPPLTTMAQPFSEIGAGAVRSLVDALEGLGGEPGSHRLPPRLMERRSV